MQQENEVYKGYLLIPTTGKLLLKKSWQQKYCYLFKASKFGIERLEIWDSNEKKGPPVRIITLENCIKITSEDDKRFTITTKANPCPYEFSALTFEDKTKWLNAFQSVAFPDDISNLTSIEEDNDLYGPSGEGIFNVKIHPSTASQRCGLNSSTQYTLVLTSNAMQLKQSNCVLYTWPYCYIRRYGYKSGKFTFEAGRKCDSGEGTFYLEHSNQQEIFRCLSAKMKSMKKLLKDESISMESQGRSVSIPLSLSPTVERKAPIKPPRKSLAKLQLYEPVDKYDKIEYRNDAWKTLGVSDVDHTEKFADDEVYMSWGDQKSQNIVPTSTKAPKIIKQLSCTDDNNYDKLEFFGSTNKLSAGYKQVSVGSGLNCISTPSVNDYDEVQPSLDEIRLADDKHLGYAMVRKNGKDKGDVDHQFCNNEPYAIISKPKRV